MFVPAAWIWISISCCAPWPRASIVMTATTPMTHESFPLGQKTLGDDSGPGRAQQRSIAPSGSH